MEKNLENLENAFRFYEIAIKDKNAYATGALNDAYEWIIKELKLLFNEEA